MQGKATIAGHPIHPILVTAPIGCFVASIACDIVSIWQGTAFWGAMGTWLIAFGVIGALVAAVAGITDFLTAPMSATAKNLASWHLMLNLAMLVVYGLAFAMRIQGQVPVLGYALSVFGFVTLLASGVLGGQVAHGHLVGSSERDVAAYRESEAMTSLGPEDRAARKPEVVRSSRRGAL